MIGIIPPVFVFGILGLILDAHERIKLERRIFGKIGHDTRHDVRFQPGGAVDPHRFTDWIFPSEYIGSHVFGDNNATQAVQGGFSIPL